MVFYPITAGTVSRDSGAMSGRAVPRKPLFFGSCGTPSTQDLVGQAAGQGTYR